MPEVAALPTRRDEAWRYSDVEAAARLWPVRSEQIEIPPGDGYARQIVVGFGAEVLSEQQTDFVFGNDASIRRLRESSDVGPNEAFATQIDLDIGAGARAAIHIVNAGGRLGRFAINARLGEGAHFEFGGVTLGGGETTREFVVRVLHAEPGATSRQVVRSVHWGKGTGNFLGTIDVARDAQKTDAVQSFKGLLLERGASANAVPQLEILADDVKCAHGATVGQLDPQAAFYMAARGIAPEAARRLLVRAFLADAFVALETEEERERMLAAALSELGDTL